MALRLRNLLLICVVQIVINAPFFISSAASPHSHDIHKERTADGAFAPRDHSHYKDGQHDASFDHEAILGSSKEAAEFDQLPAEIAKERLRLLITQKMDADGDQYLTREELKNWIMQSFSKLSKEESADTFKDADDNKDGKVSWKEYVYDTFGDEGDQMEDIETPDDKHELKLVFDEDHILFTAADKDGDQQLDKDEFVSFTHPEEDPDMHDTVVQQVLLRRDKNNDGKIEFQEFLGDSHDVEENKDKAWLLSEKASFEKDYDKNRDGFLEGEEIIDWMLPNNEETADEEVQHLFSVADSDHDSRLSVQEVLNEHRTFVGSEATEFGDQLHDEL